MIWNLGNIFYGFYIFYWKLFILFIYGKG